MLNSRNLIQHRSKRAYDPRWRFRNSHPVDLKPAKIPLVIVTGSAAAGKSYYVERNRGPDDLVIDLDEIAHDLVTGATPGFGPRPIPLDAKARLRPLKTAYLDRALHHRNELLRAVAAEECPWPKAWLIVSEPLPNRRDWWARALQPERIVVVSTPMDECLARADSDSLRATAIREYFRLYQPRESEFIVSGSADAS